MALTRKFLKALGIEDEKIEQIIEEHTNVADRMNAEISKYKADAEALPRVQKELEKAQADLEAMEKDGYKVKYETIKREFDDYKNEQTKKETHAAKESAYRNLLKTAGISEKRIDTILRVSDVDDVTLDNDGNIDDAEKLIQKVKTEWADFIVTTETHGANTAAPPANTGAAMSREQILGIKDRDARRKAIAENMNLFEKGE